MVIINIIYRSKIKLYCTIKNAWFFALQVDTTLVKKKGGIMIEHDWVIHGGRLIDPAINIDDHQKVRTMIYQAIID